MTRTVRAVCAALALLLPSSPTGAFAPAPMKQGKGDALPVGAIARLGTARLRHPGNVITVSLSPDGRTLASGGEQGDNAVFLWDAADGRRLYRLPVGGYVAHTAHSADGKWVAAAYRRADRGGSGVNIWDVQTGKMLHAFAVSEGAKKICFGPDNLLAILASQNVVLLWQPGKKTRRFGRPEGYPMGLSISPDGKRLAAGLLRLNERNDKDESPVCVWDAESGKLTHTLKGHEDHVQAFAFSRDGRRLVTGGWGEKNTVRIWDLDKGKEVAPLPKRGGAALALWLSPDDKTLVAAGGDAGLRGWRLPEGEPLADLPKLDGAGPSSQTMAISADGKRLAIGGYYSIYGVTNTVKVWDLTDGSRLAKRPGHEGAVTDLSWNSDGKWLASCSYDKAIVWDLKDGRILRAFPAGKDGFARAALSGNGAILAVGDWNSAKVRLYDVTKGEQCDVVGWEEPRPERDRVGREPARWLGFSPDGDRLAAQLGWGLLIWRLPTGRAVQGGPLTIAARGSGLFPAGFSRDGKTLQAATAMGAFVWDAEGKQRSRPKEYRPDQTNRLAETAALSPDGKLLAVAAGGDLRFYDTVSNDEVAVLHAAAKLDAPEEEYICAVTFSPDGKVLASSGGGGVVRFWDVASGKQFANREGHVGRVERLAFSPDGKSLASAGSDTCVLLWEVPSPR